MAPGQPGKMTQDSGGLGSWVGVGALSILSSGSIRPGLGPEGEMQKYQSGDSYR